MSIGRNMINERSFGIVPLQFRPTGKYLFLVQHLSKAWLLPKGHAERGETSKQTAARELMEETGLRIVKWLDHSPFTERYSFKRQERQIHKEAIYFPALVKGKIKLQTEELFDGRWIPVQDFFARSTFPEMKRIASEVSSWLLSSSAGKPSHLWLG